LGAAYQNLGLGFATERGTPIEPRTMNALFTQMLARTGLPAIRLHDARHTFATWMLQSGVSLKTVSHQLGHSSIAIIADVYTNVTCEIAKAAADALIWRLPQAPGTNCGTTVWYASTMRHTMPLLSKTCVSHSCLFLITCKNK
jgi:hypothetical protein